MVAVSNAPNAPAETRPLPAGAPRTLDSQALLGHRGEVWIAHNGHLYRLRVTAQGKLILTK